VICTASLLNGSLILDADVKLLAAFVQVTPRRYPTAPIFRDPPYQVRTFALSPVVLGRPVNATGDKWQWAWGTYSDPPGRKGNPPDPPPSVQRQWILTAGNESALWCFGADGTRGDLFTAGMVQLYSVMDSCGSAPPVPLLISAA
jgi:hypothetical protein